MDEKSENGGRYRLGRHWQTIPAVRVLEHPEHTLHAGADSVADGFGRDDVDELRAHVVDLLLPAPGIAVDERDVVQALRHRPRSRRVVCGVGEVVEVVERRARPLHHRDHGLRVVHARRREERAQRDVPVPDNQMQLVA